MGPDGWIKPRRCFGLAGHRWAQSPSCEGRAKMLHWAHVARIPDDYSRTPQPF
jgi:hypothetical protein